MDVTRKIFSKYFCFLFPHFIFSGYNKKLCESWGTYCMVQYVYVYHASIHNHTFVYLHRILNINDKM